MLPELFLKIGKGGSGRIVFIEAVGAFLIDYRATRRAAGKTAETQSAAETQKANRIREMIFSVS